MLEMNIGLYHPEFWKIHGHWDYINHTPSKEGAWNGMQFHVNDFRLSEYDFVVVHQDVPAILKLKASAGGFILVTGEEKSMTGYPVEFLNQFDMVITSRDDIEHPNVLRTFYMHPWRVKKTFDELSEMKPSGKSATLSAIISNLRTLPVHQRRFEFMTRLKAHYGDKLSWFSKGQNTFIEDKWDGLAPYEFSIAIENSRHHNYFTEKITDCFLAFTMPVYHGCPDIHRFFDDRSYLLTDPDHFHESVQLIDMAIAENLGQSRMKYIIDSRELVLRKYQFIAAVSDVIARKKKSGIRSQKKIFPQSYFDPKGIKGSVKHFWHKLMNQI